MRLKRKKTTTTKPKKKKTADFYNLWGRLYKWSNVSKVVCEVWFWIFLDKRNLYGRIDRVRLIKIKLTLQSTEDKKKKK